MISIYGDTMTVPEPHHMFILIIEQQRKVMVQTDSGEKGIVRLVLMGTIATTRYREKKRSTVCSVSKKEGKH